MACQARRAGCVCTKTWRCLRGRQRFPRCGGGDCRERCWRRGCAMRMTHGCDLAMMVAEAGSESQRNAERQGFRVAYTRVKWKRVW